MKTIYTGLRIAAVIVGAIGLYVMFGIVISDYVFPTHKPNYQDYFRPGDKLYSRFEGFEQTILNVNGEWLRTRLVVQPYAAGPPEHFHQDFAETFVVKSGTLSVLVDGEKRVAHAGETISVPPMVRHKPFNETDELVVVESDDPHSIPTKFGYVLSQLYGFMDRYENGPNTIQMLMQLSVFGDDADSWIADGPSLGIQKVLRVVMAPTARLLGYSDHYEDFGPVRQ
jgi:quercetin dioxygenase-like cupin family protein